MLANSRDFFTGLFFVAVGAAIFVVARDYGMGTMAQLGPGAFPMFLAVLMVGLGGAIAATALRDKARSIFHLCWRPLVVITAAVALFGLALEPLGLFVTVALMSLVSRVARPGQSPVESLVLALILAAGACFLFITLLGLPVRLWPAFIG